MLARHLAPALHAALTDSPVVLLNGARQTGKTTLVESLISDSFPAQYLTLDDATVLSAVQSDPDGFIAGLKGPVVLDEIQRAPGIFVAIKAAIDRQRRPGRFLLTGSANVLLLPKLSESLAGRMEILTLLPLSQGEIHGVRENFIDAAFSAAGILPAKSHSGSGRPEAHGAMHTSAQLFSAILRGGYPEIQRRPVFERRRAWFGSYITTILQRDVRDLANIESMSALPRLLSLMAARAGGLQNFAELASGSGLPQSTLKRYVTLLEATFLVQFVRPWSGNLGTRLVKAPKLYFTDTGLLAHLLGPDEERLKADGILRGPLLENFVAMELRKQSAWSRVRPEIYHFREHAGAEIDVVLEDARGRLVGIEVKAAGAVKSEDFRWLRAFATDTGKKFVRGIVLYTGEKTVAFGENLTAAPVWSLWSGHGEPDSG